MLGQAGRQPELVKLLQHETEGNTFFIVEVVRALAETAGQLDRVGEMTLPRSVFAGGMRAVVARRLQRTPEAAYPLLQVAAVAGRRLDLELLQRLAPTTPIEPWLNSCAEASVLEVQEGRWRFAHDKLREGLLLELPAAQRKSLHRQVAEALEGLYTADLSPFYPRLAHHWSQVIADGQAGASLVVKTLDYWRLAGQQAAERSANSEALAHFNTAIELLRYLLPGPERDQQELNLQLPRAGIFRSIKGVAAPETGQAYMRTRDLCRRLGKTAQLPPVLNGLYAYYLNGAEFTPARQTLEELLSLPQAQNDPTYQMIGHRGLGAVMLHTGQLIAAREHLQKSLALYDPALHGNHAVLYGIDPKEKASSYLALTLWMLGYPDQAVALERAAVAHVEMLNHSHSLAQGLTYLCILYILAQEYELVLAPAQRLLALSEEHSFPLLAAVSHIFIGGALVQGGQVEPGIAQIRRGLADCLRTGTQNNRSHFQTLLAEACGKAGLYEEGLALLEETEAWVKTSGEHWADAELYRVRGELLIAATDIHNPAAETAFRQGLEVARSQQARLWELRVATGLAEMWQKQGQPQKGLALLQPLYDAFTEGFETPDLKAASHLLETLSN
jgi:predicted ATPase